MFLVQTTDNLLSELLIIYIPTRVQVRFQPRPVSQSTSVNTSGINLFFCEVGKIASVRMDKPVLKRKISKEIMYSAKTVYIFCSVLVILLLNRV